MPGPGFKQKKITASVSLVTYKQLQNLAEHRNVMVSDYVRKLIIRHLTDLDLPIYYDMDITENAGQES